MSSTGSGGHTETPAEGGRNGKDRRNGVPDGRRRDGGPGRGQNFERGGWAFEFDRGDEGDRFKLDEVLEAEAQLLGRVTYEGFAKAWPSRGGEFADKMNSMPKYVVSKSLDEGEWENSTVLKGDVAEEVSKLKEEVDGVILVGGSAQLVNTLIENDLVDEYRLMVFPVVLGTGKRLFADAADATSLRLVDSKPAGECLILTYEPAKQSD
jgi:dihydrofolate reductase